MWLIFVVLSFTYINHFKLVHKTILIVYDFENVFQLYIMFNKIFYQVKTIMQILYI
jgi:hypothetical protein